MGDDRADAASTATAAPGAGYLPSTGVTGPPALPSRGTGNGLAFAALALPLAEIVAEWFLRSEPASFLLSMGTVFATAILIAIDASRLGSVDHEGRPRWSARRWFFYVVGLWMVFYPYAFFRRSAFRAPNLGGPALVVTIIALLNPFLIVVPELTPQLPSCNSPEVKRLMKQILPTMPDGRVVRFVDRFREVEHDAVAEVRYGECLAHTESEAVPVGFMIQWNDPEKKTFLLRLELPGCGTADVTRLVEKLIRAGLTGEEAVSIDGHLELSYDRSAQVRHGRCIAHTESGDMPVRYRVEWSDRDASIFRVRLEDPVLPACDSREVRQFLDQMIPAWWGDGTVRSIGGHREIPRDGDEGEDGGRLGECIVHTDTGDVPLRFTVQWLDATKTRFTVHLLPPDE